jgi:RecB family exonuclease
MSGALVHVLRRIPPDPIPPKQWSFSSFNAFRKCPLRWYLSRCRFDKFGGQLPQRLSRAVVEGDLLHSLLEAYYSQEHTREVFRPRHLLATITEEWYAKNWDNPRCDVFRLRHQLSAVDVLSQFWKAVEFCGEPEPRRYQPRGTSRHFGGGATTGVEVWLQDPDSKLQGRCDLIKGKKLVDFKTGEPHEWHTEQVLFYAALLYAQHGKLVDEVEVVYLDTDKRVDASVPSADGLMERLGLYRKMASQADEVISSGGCEALPNEVECRRCPMRMLCPTYFDDVVPMRVIDPNAEGGRFYDFSLATAKIRLEESLVAVTADSRSGPVGLLCPRSLVASVANEDLPSLRVIGASVRKVDQDGVSLTLTSSSEIFALLR